MLIITMYVCIIYAYKLSLQIKILNRIQCTLGARVLDRPTIGQSDQPDSVSVSVYPSLKTIACS